MAPNSVSMTPNCSPASSAQPAPAAVRSPGDAQASDAPSAAITMPTASVALTASPPITAITAATPPSSPISGAITAIDPRCTAFR